MYRYQQHVTYFNFRRIGNSISTNIIMYYELKSRLFFYQQTDCICGITNQTKALYKYKIINNSCAMFILVLDR